MSVENLQLTVFLLGVVLVVLSIYIVYLKARLEGFEMLLEEILEDQHSDIRKSLAEKAKRLLLLDN